MLASRPRRPQAIRLRPEPRPRRGRRLVVIAVLLLVAAMFLLANPVGAADLVGASQTAVAMALRAGRSIS
jgi:hypothetical protein